MRTFTKALMIAAIAGAAATPLVIAAETHIAPKQPHMTAALHHLEAAKKELEAAAPDKGGHRVEAIKAVDSAIEHTKAGIAAGK